MVQSRGFEEHEDDCEIIPLRSAPTYKTYNDDDEDLPSYNEAIKDERNAEAHQTTYTVSEIFVTPRPQLSPENTLPGETTFAKRRQTTLVLIVLLLIPGGALLIGGIYCGAQYLSNTWAPTPPTATFPPAVNGIELSFIVLVVLGMILLYPALFWWMLVLWLPPTWMMDCLGRGFFVRRRTTPSDSQRLRRGKRNCGICCGLTLLYIAIMIVAIAVPIQLANNPNTIVSITLAKDPWAGSYIILDSTVANGTTGLTYSRNGDSTGNTTLTYFQGGWSVQTSNGSQPLANITYNNAVPNQTYPFGTKFSATCKSNSTRNCTVGGLTSNPVSLLNDSTNSHTPEFKDYIVLQVTTLVPFSVLNVSSNTTVAMTTNQAYQGIGQVYAPLGVWTLGDNPLLEVAWSTSSFGACQGLDVFLSKDNEGIAWLVFGLVWQWWMMWGENQGGCINWANSYVDVGVNGLPIGLPGADR